MNDSHLLEKFTLKNKVPDENQITAISSYRKLQECILKTKKTLSLSEKISLISM
jgi:hypothetical protein